MALDLQNKTVKEKANLKSDEIVRLAQTGTHDDAKYQLKVDIQSIEKIEGGVQILARAWKGAKQLGFGHDGSVDIERFRIFNPPILVADPLGDIERVFTDPKGVPNGSARYREDPIAATHSVLADIMRQVGKEDTEIVVGKVGNTTSTFFAAADGYTARDYGAPGGGQIWATIRAATGNDSNTSGVTTFVQVAADSGSGNWLSMLVSIFIFDTSAIPDTDTISSATASFFGVAKIDAFSDGLVLTSADPISQTAIANGDYSDHTTDMATEYGTARITYAAFSTVAYNDFTLNATGLAAISKTGNTLIGLRSINEFDNTEPTWASLTTARAQIIASETAGTDSDPKLVVVHAGAGGIERDSRALNLLGVG